ncbi:MAG: formate dehydrogenase accessory sulfurtransferase FdhD [Steroidobacteraceae bacterium]|jgi:FdhD protein
MLLFSMIMTAPCYRTQRERTIESLDTKALVLGPSAQSLKPLDNAPRLSRATAEVLRQVTIVDERDERRSVLVPIERPLRVLLDGQALVTLMTLGAAPEWLVMGYLRNQRVIDQIDEIDSVSIEWASGTARVQSRVGERADRTSSGPWARSGCALGTAFGDPMRAIEGLELPDANEARISRSVLLSILETMRAHDDIHRAAGSVHGCALFGAQNFWFSIEDVSRHNGVDTVTGWMALHGVAGGDKVFFTTGRLTGEMVMKAAFNGIPILITRNGVTDMGLKIATQLRMSLFGRAANRRYLCYSGAERFDSHR